MQEITRNNEELIFQEPRELPKDSTPIKVDVRKSIEDQAVIVKIGDYQVWMSAEGAKALSLELRRAANEIEKYCYKKAKKGYHVKRGA